MFKKPIEKKDNQLFFILIWICNIIYSIFPPILFINIGNDFKNLNGLFFLMNNKLHLSYLKKVNSISIPTILKISIVIGIFLTILGGIFFLLKKFVVCSILNIFSALSSFLFIFLLGLFKKDILQLNIPLSFISINILFPYIVHIILKITLAIISILKKGKETLFEAIFFCCCITALLIVGSIFIFIAIYGLPSFFKIGFFQFVFNDEWNPFLNRYGIRNFLIGSIVATFGAVFLAAPVGICAATFMSEIANKKIAYIFNTIVEILASIPSVIYGLFGMTTIVPLIKKIFSNPNSSFVVVGDSLLAAILVLAIMILPNILSTSYLALKSNIKNLKEASLNLGATKTQTIFKVSLKAARFGIFSGINLSIAKAFGETMAVIMVAGNVPNKINLLKPARLLTTGIAIDISYASGLLRQALFGIGLILFVLIILINFSFKRIISRKFK